MHLPFQWETFVYDLTSTKKEISFSYFSESNDVSISKRWCCSDPGNQRFLCKKKDVVALIDDEKNCVSLYDVKATKLIGKPRKFSKHLKILGMFTVWYYENRSTFFYWNEISSYLHSETDESQFRSRDWAIPCDSKPKLLKFQDHVILFVEDDNKVTLYDSDTRLKVEVLQRHHGMSQIDDVVLSSHTSALFLDCGKRTVLVCGFTLSHSYSLNWQIQEIYRWDNVGGFDCMTWDDGKLVGSRSAEMFVQS